MQHWTKQNKTTAFSAPTSFSCCDFRALTWPKLFKKWCLLGGAAQTLALFLFFSRHLSMAALLGGRGGRKGKKAAAFCLGLFWFFSGWQILWWLQKVFYAWGGKRPTEMSCLLQGVGSGHRGLTPSPPLPSQTPWRCCSCAGFASSPRCGELQPHWCSVAQKLDTVGGSCSDRKAEISSSDKRRRAGGQHQCQGVSGLMIWKNTVNLTASDTDPQNHRQQVRDVKSWNFFPKLF